MTYQLVKGKEFPSLLIRNMATTNIKKSLKLYRLYKLYFEKKKSKKSNISCFGGRHQSWQIYHKTSSL